MRYITLIVLCSLLFSCNTSNNSNEGDKMDTVCAHIIESFFKKMEQNDFKAAVNDLLLSNENINSNDSATLAMKDRFYSINMVSGTYRGSKLLKKRFIQNSLAIYSYLAKYDRSFTDLYLFFITMTYKRNFINFHSMILLKSN